MRVNKKIIIGIFTAAFISGCSSTEEKQLDLPEDVSVPGADTGGASTTGYQGDSASSGMAIQSIDEYGNAIGGVFDDPQHPLSKQTIYFMYDSSQVQPDYLTVITAHAQYLAAHPGQLMVLEGHADERGSREYNIALSEQRAKAVSRMMKMQGVASTQLRIVSYGEEKPAAEGNDAAAWQLNRRVELVYQAQ